MKYDFMFEVKLIFMHRHNVMLQQSKEQLSDLITTTTITFDLSKHFKQISTKKIKDITCIDIYQDTIYIGSKESKVFVFEINVKDKQNSNFELINQRTFYPHCTSSSFILTSSLYIIVVPMGEQQIIRIWNRDTLKIIHGYKGHQKQISSVIFLQDNKNLASISYDGSVRIWGISDLFQLDEQKRKYYNKYPLLALAEINSSIVAFGGDDSFITLWNWEENVVIQSCFSHPGSLTNLTLFPPYLLSTGGDSQIKIWKINEKKQPGHHSNNFILNNQILYYAKTQIKQINTFSQNLSQIVFSAKMPNQQILITDSRGNTIMINHSLQVISSRLQLKYTDSIRSIHFWKHILLVVASAKGKGVLKCLQIDFKDILTKQKSFHKRQSQNGSAMQTTLVQIGTKHSIELQNVQQNGLPQLKEQESQS